MRTAAAVSMATALALVVTGCNSGQGGASRERVKRIDRVLAGTPGEAQPTRIIATEIAFTRAASEDGQAKAYAEFSTQDALIHGPGGPVSIAASPVGNDALVWSTKTVWMSCDAELAISQGRVRNPAGMVGNYLTVWKRQRGGTYRWAYNLIGYDDPQPTEPTALQQQDGDIVVTAISSVNGQVADCAKAGAAGPVPSALTVSRDIRSGAFISPDQTLQLGWSHKATGERMADIEWAHVGQWQQAYNLTIPASRNR